MKNNILKLRKERGLSQEALGVLVGTNGVQINRLEKSERRLTHDWMVKLAKALDVEPADLISDGIVKATPAAASSQSINILMETWLACTDVAKALRLKKKIPKSQDSTPLIVSATKYFFDKFAEGNPPDADEIEKFMLSIIS